MFSIQEIINKSIKTERQDRKIKHWNISKLGSCLRGVYLERLGTKPDYDFDDRTLRVFSVGRIFEEWIIDLIRVEGNEVEIRTQGRVENEKYDVAGYYDLMIKKNGEKVIYEIKTKHSRAFWYMDKKGEGASEQHKMQLWAYLWLSGIDEGRIIYLSKDDLAILEYPIHRKDRKIEKAVMKELELLNEAWEKKDPSILPLIDGKDWRSKYCRWHKQCIVVDQLKFDLCK